MSLVISHASALALYRSPETASKLRHAWAHKRNAACTWPVEAPSHHDAHAAAQRYQLPLPLHTLVPLATTRRTSSTQRAHVWSEPLPHGALLPLAAGIFVVSPAFLYLLLARTADFENLLMLGEELTGYFALDPSCQMGLVNRSPLLTPQELRAFLDACVDSPNVKRARRAAAWILGRARSPKEAELGQLLHLPRIRGGRGIRDVELNVRFDLTEEGRRIAGCSYLEGDVYLPRFRRVYEYDSIEFHLSHEQHERDERKRNALRTIDVDVVGITAGQLHSWQLIDTLLSESERAQHGKHRPASDAMRSKQHDLWKRLVLGVRRGGKTIVSERNRNR